MHIGQVRKDTPYTMIANIIINVAAFLALCTKLNAGSITLFPHCDNNVHHNNKQLQQLQ
jgi:hypothetical protein